MNENAERWLAFAHEDLAAAKAVAKEALHNQACFHAQQCAEKAIKAVLAIHAAPPKLHSISELIESASVELTRDLKDALIILDDYYIPTRYPDTLPGSLPNGLPDANDAQEAIRTAEEFLTLIVTHLKGSSPL